MLTAADKPDEIKTGTAEESQKLLPARFWKDSGIGWGRRGKGPSNLRDCQYARTEGARCKMHGRYRILYTIEDNHALILRVLHGARDA